MKTIDEILTTVIPLGNDSKKQLIALLPMLEHKWSEDISYKIIKAGFQPEKILILALLEGSDYWRDLAIQWVRTGFPICKKLAATLEKLGKSKMGTQSTRHTAFKYAVQWKKEMQNK